VSPPRCRSWPAVDPTRCRGSSGIFSARPSTSGTAVGVPAPPDSLATSFVVVPDSNVRRPHEHHSNLWGVCSARSTGRVPSVH
jgi:hypothetical protein